MLDMDGFVIDLTTKETCKEWFDCFTLEKYETYDDLTLNEIRDIIVDYYANINGNYYLIATQPNVYFVIEKELLKYEI